MTRYAIADIHGGAKTLHALLGRLGLRSEKTGSISWAI